ncbi:hypothetical protein M8998_06390 [Sphingobacterium sp. lm-10]|uniref:hypothetical protein n=1 Tax=Sphingobacterium sp. lm-10 TaxID=2944904 RepID=UPI0020216409|nr:hypothetical protein [Sphingobacterium sp. lm-10]MCL7987562.1 hypothetical protein [Sphingobacterium sp. lm-10]
MKKLFLYFFLVLVAGESFMLCQLSKLPALYSHFASHQDINPNVCFSDFLSMHYWGEDLPDDDDKEDMKLPFKQFDLNAFSFVFVSHCHVAVAIPTVHLVPDVFGLMPPNNYIPSYSTSCFRPPQA